MTEPQTADLRTIAALRRTLARDCAVLTPFLAWARWDWGNEVWKEVFDALELLTYEEFLEQAPTLRRKLDVAMQLCPVGGNG